jgi:hypothetical protein
MARDRKVADDEAEEIRDRIDLRAEPEWIGRVKRQADRLGMTISSYVRMATTRQVESDEASDPKPRARR